MFVLNDYLSNEHDFEHVLEHSLLKKKKFSAPKIYSANGNLSKRWYVYFSYRNPETGNLQRMKNIYGVANNFSTKEERLTILTTYRNKLLKLLKEGFNPFEDNTSLLEKRKQKALKEHSNNDDSVKESPIVPLGYKCFKRCLCMVCCEV